MSRANIFTLFGKEISFKGILKSLGLVFGDIGTSPMMQQGRVIDLDSGAAVNAAKIGHELKLSLTDAVIVANARIHHAVLWTQNADLKNVEGVKFVKKS